MNREEFESEEKIKKNKVFRVQAGVLCMATHKKGLERNDKIHLIYAENVKKISLKEIKKKRSQLEKF